MGAGVCTQELETGSTQRPERAERPSAVTAPVSVGCWTARHTPVAGETGAGVHGPRGRRVQRRVEAGPSIACGSAAAPGPRTGAPSALDPPPRARRVTRSTVATGGHGRSGARVPAPVGPVWRLDIATVAGTCRSRAWAQTGNHGTVMAPVEMGRRGAPGRPGHGAACRVVVGNKSAPEPVTGPLATASPSRVQPVRPRSASRWAAHQTDYTGSAWGLRDVRTAVSTSAGRWTVSATAARRDVTVLSTCTCTTAPVSRSAAAL